MKSWIFKSFCDVTRWQQPFSNASDPLVFPKIQFLLEALVVVVAVAVAVALLNDLKIQLFIIFIVLLLY